jgi:hypothetical protein
MTDDRIGRLFPAGGPVPADLVIGRTGDIEEIMCRSREAIHTMLTGPRRIGKTTVCAAACEQLRQDGTVVVDIEVPERTDAKDLLQLLVDRCNRISRSAATRGLLRVALPLIEQTLADQGIPLDLGQLATAPGSLPTRKILDLPLALAEERAGRSSSSSTSCNVPPTTLTVSNCSEISSISTAGAPRSSYSSTAATSEPSTGCLALRRSSGSSSID